MEGSEQDDSSPGFPRQLACAEGEAPKIILWALWEQAGKRKRVLDIFPCFGDTFSFAIFIIRREIWPKSDFFLPFSYGVCLLLLVSLFCLGLFCCVFWFCFGFFFLVFLFFPFAFVARSSLGKGPGRGSGQAATPGSHGTAAALS